MTEPAPHPIPLATLDRPIAFVGATGSGKTTAAKGAVERLLDAGRRVVVVDPTGVWWGLRLRADGGPGFPVVIFGGEHADVPIGPDAGDRLGRLLAAGEVGAAIVDTSDLSTAETTALLTPMFEGLYAGLRGALHLVVDEADAMAPQNPMPEGRRLLGVVDKIARRGRVKGFRPLWITQRPAVLNKNVLSQVSTLVAMQLRSPQDRKALDAWIQGNADAETARGVVRRLPGLPVGSGFVWAPGDDRLDLVAFPPAATFDSSRAPDPGEVDAAVAPLGAVDVAALRAVLAPADAALESVGRRSPDMRSATAAPAAVVGPTHAEARAAAERARAEGYAQGWQDALNGALGVVDGGASELRRRLEAGPSHPVTIDAPPRIAPNLEVRRAAAASRPTARPHIRLLADGYGLNSAARKMLAVFDTDPPVRRSWATAARLAVLKPRGGHFNAGRRQLLEAGLVVEDDGLVRVAAPSRGARPFAFDAEQLSARWAQVLGGLAARILAELDTEHPAHRDTVAVRLGVQPRGGHWTSAWTSLRDNGLIDEADGRARLSALFRGEP